MNENQIHLFQLKTIFIYTEKIVWKNIQQKTSTVVPNGDGITGGT